MDKNVLLKQARSNLRELLDNGQICLADFLEAKLPTLDISNNQTWWDYFVG